MLLQLICRKTSFIICAISGQKEYPTSSTWYNCLFFPATALLLQMSSFPFPSTHSLYFPEVRQNTGLPSQFYKSHTPSLLRCHKTPGSNVVLEAMNPLLLDMSKCTDYAMGNCSHWNSLSCMFTVRIVFSSSSNPHSEDTQSEQSLVSSAQPPSSAKDLGRRYWFISAGICSGFIVPTAP